MSLFCFTASPPQLRGFQKLEISTLRQDLARLLLAFFNWAAEDLPRLQSFTLSVSSAKAERRAGPFKPLILAVPFAPGENAARCLRADVWEMLIRRELQRASRFMKQVVSQSGPDRRDAWLSGRIQHSVRTRSWSRQRKQRSLELRMVQYSNGFILSCSSRRHYD